jgi:hypothetical protein
MRRICQAARACLPAPHALPRTDSETFSVQVLPPATPRVVRKERLVALVYCACRVRLITTVDPLQSASTPILNRLVEQVTNNSQFKN